MRVLFFLTTLLLTVNALCDSHVEEQDVIETADDIKKTVETGTDAVGPDECEAKEKQKKRKRKPKAKQKPPTNAMFCAEPMVYICAHPDVSVNARAERSKTVRKKIANRALAKTAKELGFVEADDAEFTFEDLKKLPPVQQVLVAGYYGVQLIEELKAVQKGYADIAFKNVDKIKNGVEKAVDRKAADGQLSADMHAKMKAALKDVKIIQSQDVLESSSFSEGAKSQFVNSFIRFCGIDGFADNAFATRLDGKPYVLICPGWLYGAVGEGESTPGNFLNLMHVLAHEYAHFIDYPIFPDAYSNMETCIFEYHKNLFPTPEAFKELPKHPIVSHIAQAVSVREHMVEITADYWAVQSMAQFIEDSKDKLSMEGRLQIARESLSGYCDSKGDKTHPNGYYRIQVILRGDKLINDLFECPMPDKENFIKPSGCGLTN